MIAEPCGKLQRVTIEEEKLESEMIMAGNTSKETANRRSFKFALFID